ncbi:hypothetical protein NC652_028818 [Populus alba x Populus x berolinensis]|nr:hypothetical protein NC652_028818 [Populus alba x Populus x berolinensis]
MTEEEASEVLGGVGGNETNGLLKLVCKVPTREAIDNFSSRSVWIAGKRMKTLMSPESFNLHVFSGIMKWAYGLNVLVHISHFLMLEHMTKCDLALASNFFCPESGWQIVYCRIRWGRRWNLFHNHWILGRY